MNAAIMWTAAEHGFAVDARSHRETCIGRPSAKYGYTGNREQVQSWLFGHVVFFNALGIKSMMMFTCVNEEMY